MSSRPVRWLLRSAAVMCLTSGCLAVISGTTAAAQTNFAQATEVTAPPNAAFNPFLDGVSCTSAGNCVAVGAYEDIYGHYQAMAATEAGGIWAQAADITLPSNANHLNAMLDSVSCASAGNCVAVGGYYDSSSNLQAMAVTETGGIWAQATEVTAPANALSNPDAVLRGVSCTSEGNCVAVGDYTDSGEFSAAPFPLYNNLVMAVTETGGTWARATEVTTPSNSAGRFGPVAALESVSCTSAGNCVAVGGYASLLGLQGMTATETDGTWAQATEVIAPSNASGNPNATLYGVSCTSAGNCVAIGDYTDSSFHQQAMSAIETSGTFGQATEMTLPSNAASNPGADFFSVSCTSAGTCVGIGNYQSSSSQNQTVAVTETGGIFGPATEVTAPPNAAGPNDYPSLFGVSCASADNCVAVGDYLDNSGHYQAMAASSAPPPPPQPPPLPLSGYWEVTADGSLFPFGIAQFFGLIGGMPLNKPIVGMAFDSATLGYYLVASDGGIFAFNAPFLGSMGGKPLNSPIVGMAFDPATGGYYLLSSDGGIFAFNAPFLGSMGGKPLNSPIVGMAFDSATGGYYLVASDGGIFAFNAPFFGSMGGTPLNKPIVGITSVG